MFKKFNLKTHSKYFNIPEKMERGKGTKSIVSQNEAVIGEILAEQTRTEKIHLFLTVSRRKAFKLLVH